MPKPDLLIRTKLHLPFIRPGLVYRPRLQDQIKRGLSSPLTMITAPAGFGKTTLVASCVTDCGKPVAWLSLDKNDNQVGRFLRYLIASLQEADPNIGGEAAQVLAAAPEAAHEAILTSLINDLDTSNVEIVQVLDDYQIITSPEVHEAITFLLQHCPQTFHLVIATRSDPPLPLARLRARGQIVELRSTDLCFSESESAKFLNDVMGLRLDNVSVTVLKERTEGWIAGLQMAALALQGKNALQSHLSIDGRGNIPEFIKAFSGTNRYILDYLLEEVLAGQSPEIQHFLLHTSILERLTAPLCDDLITAVQGLKVEGDALSRHSESFFPRRSASILEYLERANLFLFPLDDERTWYRYHHLFAELLRARLHQWQPDLIRELHHRAANWHRHKGSLEEAMDHALIAQDYEMATEILEQHRLILGGLVSISTYLAWVQAIPQDQLIRRPILCLRYAFVLALAGHMEHVGELIQAVEHFMQEHPEPDPDRARDQAALFGYVSGYYASHRGDLDGAISHARVALEQAREEDSITRSTIMSQLGEFYIAKGELGLASQWLWQAMELHKRLGQIQILILNYASLVKIAQVQGHLRKAVDLCQESLSLIKEQGERPLGFAGVAFTRLADILCERNELVSALQYARKGVEQTGVFGQPYQHAVAYSVLARVLLAAGDIQDVQALLREEEALAKRHTTMPQVKDTLDLGNVRIWLANGDLSAARSWASAQSLNAGTRPDDYRLEEQYLLLVRIHLAQGQVDEALALLTQLQRSMEAGERNGRLIEALVLHAMAFSKQNKPIQALEVLGKALGLAESEGYARVFLNEGQPMRLLLTQWLANSSSSPARDYALQLLTQFDAELHKAMTAHEQTFPAGEPSASSGQTLEKPEIRSAQNMLVEPISQRELEVLHLMALGKTNPEIAQQLVVSPGTIKAHAASIYRKLDVANRTEAVTRARQLGLLP